MLCALCWKLEWNKLTVSHIIRCHYLLGTVLLKTPAPVSLADCFEWYEVGLLTNRDVCNSCWSGPGLVQCSQKWHVWLLQLLSLLLYTNTTWKLLSCSVTSQWRSLLSAVFLTMNIKLLGNTVKCSTGFQGCACLEKSLSKASLGRPRGLSRLQRLKLWRVRRGIALEWSLVFEFHLALLHAVWPPANQLNSSCLCLFMFKAG